MYFFTSKKKIKFLSYKTIIIALILTSFIACSDNATKLAENIESAVKKLQSKGVGSEYIIYYLPLYEKDRPYTIIFLPEKETTLHDLIEKGVDPDIAKSIFSSLSYQDKSKGEMLIVYQAGKISFTTYYRRFASVSDIQTLNSTGKSEIVVKKIAKNRVIIELR